MKILAVGYACSPNGGSEPGVGWTAVCRIARNHDVWVLADIHNRKGWEMAGAEGRIPANVQVRFLQDASPCSENRFIAHAQSWLNYRKFNKQVLKAALAWHEEIGFDLCHQVTIAAWRLPSPLWQMPIPFVWGPIGGAGYIPRQFRGMLSYPARNFERIRDWQTAHTLHSGKFRQCIDKTAVVLAANEETEVLLKPFRREKPMMRLPIVSISEEKARQFTRPRSHLVKGTPLRLFAGGNIEGRKGVGLALKALGKAKQAGINFHYIVAGGGPEVHALQQLSKQLGLQGDVTFHPGYKGGDYIHALHQSDVYFLPSFRESTPVTLLEACLAGCYPVVADTSAQGEIVRLIGGMAVPVQSIGQVVDDLAEAIAWCSEHRSELPGLASAGAARITEHFCSERYDMTLELAYSRALAAK